MGVRERERARERERERGREGIQEGGSTAVGDRIPLRLRGHVLALVGGAPIPGQSSFGVSTRNDGRVKRANAQNELSQSLVRVRRFVNVGNLDRRGIAEAIKHEVFQPQADYARRGCG